MDAAAAARLLYEHGQFRVLSPGTFVLCAVTGTRIPLDDLRYWSVPLQEPYVSPEAALRRLKGDGSPQ